MIELTRIINGYESIPSLSENEEIQASDTRNKRNLFLFIILGLFATFSVYFAFESYYSRCNSKYCWEQLFYNRNIIDRTIDPSLTEAPDEKRIARPKRRICQYGGYCRSNADCVIGNMCIIQNQFYSQCIPDTSQYLLSDCASNWGEKCDDNTVCCDPGALCNNKQYRQCSQPEFSSCLLPLNYTSPENFTAYHESPSMEPTLISTTSANLICQYSGYCTIDSDCVFGNRCQVQSPYYSQCVPDSSQYLPPSTNCVSNWGNQCDDTSICCDPGAVCNGGSDSNNLFRQCSQPTTGCLNPHGFTSPSSSPTTQIGGAGLYLYMLLKVFRSSSF